LQDPAVPVRITEGCVQDAPEILDLTDHYSPVDELRTRGVYVRDDQVQALDGAGRRVYDPDPKGDRASRPGGASCTMRLSLLTLGSVSALTSRSTLTPTFYAEKTFARSKSDMGIGTSSSFQSMVRLPFVWWHALGWSIRQ
jgi:hypothetical protein